MAIRDTVAPPYFNRLGIAMAMRTYRAYRELLVSSRWQKLSARGAHPQRLLWASTGSKDAATRDTFYVEALIAPGTINTVPEKTLLAFADHGRVGPVLPEDGGYAEEVLDELRREGVNDEVLAVRLQRVGVNNFTESWRLLMQRIQNKSLLPRMSTNALVA
jgi:transaldolase